jgi:hypothetical protein
MATINITITESPLEKAAGIPASVTLSTNVPATIFFTLDGLEPTYMSMVAVGPITLPTDDGTVTLKAFATDGYTSSPVITQDYGASFVPLRQPRDKVIGLDNKCKTPTFPYGSPASSSNPAVMYGNTGGIVVDNKLQPQIPDGYDGTATNTVGNYTNRPLNLGFYDLEYSETDNIGKRGRGIGTLPANTTIIKQRNNNEIVEKSDANSAFFNPKALVIYQDGREPQYDEDIPRLNRPSFSLERPGVARDGALLQTAPEGISPSGSFTRWYYNPKENTITYYYYDNRVHRWIISKEPYTPKPNTVTNMSTMVFSSRGKGAGFVFKWIPFKYRRLI